MNQKQRNKILGNFIAIVCFVLSIIFFAKTDFGKELIEQYSVELGFKKDNDFLDDYDLNIHVLDVGVADCILIETETECFLIDGATPEYSEYILKYVKSLGIDEIDALIVTHPDYDHFSGLEDLLKEIDIKTFYSSGTENDTKAYQSFLRNIEEKDIESKVIKRGDIIFDGDLSLEVIAPIENYDDDNNMSVVIRLDYNKFSALFTGDAEIEEIDDMIENNKFIDTDLLKVGHHGSKNATTQKFLEAVTPDYAVISTGTNKYDFPDNEVINLLDKSGIEYYRTDLDGTIVFSILGENTLHITTEESTYEKTYN